MDDDEEDQCIRLLSFCKKHRQPSNERPTADERIERVAHQYSEYTPPPNPSGCARSGVPSDISVAAHTSQIVLSPLSLSLSSPPLSYGTHAHTVLIVIMGLL